MTPTQLCLIFSLTYLSFALSNTYTTPKCDSCTLVNEARHFLEYENEKLRQRKHKISLAQFNIQTHLTNYNSELLANVSVEYAAANRELAERIRSAGYDKINDEFIKRQVKFLMDIGSGILPKDDVKELEKSLQNMISDYGMRDNAKSEKEKYNEDHQDVAKLADDWAQLHDAIKTTVRDNFRTYVELSNKAARLNNYTSHADYWKESYKDKNFESNIDAAYNAIYPLYKELHGYLRHHLRKEYGNDVISPYGNIPEHLINGFVAHIDLYLPFPKKPIVNITSELLRHGYNVTRIIEHCDEFFNSLNMRPLPKSFWKLSILERQPNVSMICHPMAWDMYKDSDVRITMCAKVNEYTWYAIHHELGHNQYFLQYKSQPSVFRDSPHPGFHEAIGDLITLFVGSQRHLKQIGLVNDGLLDEESRINKLFKMATDKKIYFLPQAYSVDKWRFQVFRNEINESIWNCAYWIYRSKYSGIEPAVLRTENNFDPSAIYHVNTDVDLLRYFTSFIFQFQFYKALCLKAGQYKLNSTEEGFTLDNCDIYNSKEAGAALAKFLALGRSKHWKEALEELTGETTLDPTAMLEYFKPLHEWLQRENKRLNVTLGWTITNKVTCDLPRRR